MSNPRFQKFEIKDQTDLLFMMGAETCTECNATVSRGLSICLSIRASGFWPGVSSPFPGKMENPLGA